MRLLTVLGDSLLTTKQNSPPLQRKLGFLRKTYWFFEIRQLRRRLTEVEGSFESLPSERRDAPLEQGLKFPSALG
jgi:hypothetical protein